MTKRFPSALASAVVAKKMINTQAGRFALVQPLIVVLAASSAARGRCADTCLTWATGRAARTVQPESGRRSWAAAASVAALPC
jgi:hypothetical protein